MNKIVEAKPTEIVVFDEVASIIAEYQVENENLAFEYTSKEGAKAAKSHISNLRKVKTKIGEVHKEAKAEALAFGRRLDAKKNEYNGEVDKMIKFHKDPLDTIEAKLIEESVRRQQELAEAEAKKNAEMEARERAVILAEEKVAREKDEAEEKIRRETAAESERVMKEQQEKIAVIEEEKRIAEEKVEKLRAEAEEKAKVDAMVIEAKKIAEAEAEEERLADIAAEKNRIEAEEAEKAKAQAELRTKIEDKKHRKKIEDEVHHSLYTECGLDEDDTNAVLEAIKEGKIPHVSINY